MNVCVVFAIFFCFSFSLFCHVRSLSFLSPFSRSDDEAEKWGSSSEEETDSSEDDLPQVQWDESGYGDAADRAYLQSLPEVEREEILYERAEQRRKITDRRAIRQQVKERQKEQRSQLRTSKRKRSAASEHSQRSRLQALKDLTERRLGKRPTLARTDTARWDSDDEDDEMDDEDAMDQHDRAYVDEAEQASRARRARVEERDSEEQEKRLADEQGPQAELEHLESVRLSRSALARHMNKPYFRKLVPGFFVRVVIGEHLGERVYRMAEVVELHDGNKTYRLEKQQTNLVLLLRHAGSSPRPFRMEFVSDSPITGEEFREWVSAMHKAKRERPRVAHIEELQQRLEEANNYNYTHEDVKRMVEENRANAQTLGTNASALAEERARVLNLRDVAKQRGHLDEYDQMVERLAEVEALIDQEREFQSSEKKDTIQLINKRNISQNFRLLDEHRSKVCGHTFHLNLSLHVSRDTDSLVAVWHLGF
jgi:RNA polymerase-associated protein RTF1